jgi:hypothetical protein
MQRFWTAVLALVALTVPSAASAQLLECAADTHLTRKGDYLNGTTGEVDGCVWPWEIPCPPGPCTFSNIQGITADGMLHATVTTRNPAYALAVFDTANLLVGRYNAAPTQRPFAQDVSFLLDVCAFDPSEYGLAMMESNEAYCTLAAQYYSRVVGDFPNPHDNVDRHITPRKSIAGWDVAWHSDASWRAEFETYAAEMVARILERRPDWEHMLLGGFDYTEISWGMLIRVIVEMHAAGDLGIAAYNEGLGIADELIALQALDGSWGGSDPQTTAYAVLGLRTDPFNAEWNTAVIRGVNFLEAFATAPPICGWSYPPEFGEVNSEVLMALSASQALPFIDGFETGDTSAWSSSVGVPPLQDNAPRLLRLPERPAATPAF